MENRTEMVELSVTVTDRLMGRVRREAANRGMTIDELVRDVLAVWLADSLSNKRIDPETYARVGVEGNLPGEELGYGEQIITRQKREKDARNKALSRMRAANE